MGLQILLVNASLGQQTQILKASGGGFQHWTPELASAALTLPDDTTLEPFHLGFRDGEPAEPRQTGDAWQAWFEIPVDLEAAELRMVARPYERRSGLVEELGDTVAVEARLEFENGS